MYVCMCVCEDLGVHIKLVQLKPSNQEGTRFRETSDADLHLTDEPARQRAIRLGRCSSKYCNNKASLLQPQIEVLQQHCVKEV